MVGEAVIEAVVASGAVDIEDGVAGREGFGAASVMCL